MEQKLKNESADNGSANESADNGSANDLDFHPIDLDLQPPMSEYIINERRGK